MIEWDERMCAYFFWDESGIKQGYWENKDDAQEAFEMYSHNLMKD